MNSEKNAVIAMMGLAHNELRIIDNHINSVDPNAKFAGRSSEIKQSLESFLSESAPPQAHGVIHYPGEHHALAVVDQHANIPSPRVEIMAPVQKSEEGQLEFNFTENTNSILKEIREALLSIKYLLQKATTPTEVHKPAPYKYPKISTCCICGTEAKSRKSGSGHYTVTCNNKACKNSETAALRLDSIIKWNSKNKSLN